MAVYSGGFVALFAVFILGPAHAVYGYRNGRGRDRLEASLCRPSETPLTEPTSADAPRS
jgi:hypothetical protein